MKKLIRQFFIFLDKVYIIPIGFLSAFLTGTDIFPAYFISVPFTLYIATITSVKGHWEDDFFGTVGFIIIGTSLLIQLVFPMNFWDFGFDAYNLRRISTLYIYISFVFLGLFLYYDDGKLIIKDKEELIWKDGEVLVKDNDGERKEDFFMTVHKILFIHPGFIFILSLFLYGALVIIFPKLVTFLFNFL